MIHLFFLLLLSIASFAVEAQPAKRTNRFNLSQVSAASFEEQYVQLQTGVTLEFVEWGNKKGTPVIFLHGISDSWHSFEKVLPLLPGSIHAFALTHRGHGNSSKPETGYRPMDLAADVAAFILQNKIGSAILVGHSMSGIVVQQIALSYPHLTKGIVIVASDPVMRDNPGMPEFSAEVSKMEGPFDRTFMIEFQKATLAKPIDSSYFNLLVDESMKMPLPIFKAALKGLAETDFVPELKNIKTPVLILWGDADGFFKAEGQNLLRKHLSHAKYITYKGTGHAIHWEEPVKFAMDIVAFVDSIQKS